MSPRDHCGTTAAEIYWKTVPHDPHCHIPFNLFVSKSGYKQAQHRAAMETAARINCSSESFGIAFYCFNCSNCNSELCLFLTRSKCICMHMYRDACLTAVVLFVLTYERCLPWGEAVCVGWRNESRNITPINVQSRAPLSITPVPLRQLELFLTDKFVLSKIMQ